MPRYSFGEVPASIGSAPHGYKVTERARVIGHGDSAFARAKEAIWTWQIQAGSRFEPLTVPERTAVGAVSRFRIRFGPLRPTVTCRVFAVIDQSERAGFAHEAIRGHPQSGWESFIVERDGDNVVLRIRVVARPAAWWMRAAGPAGDIALHLLLRRNLHSLDKLLVDRTVHATSD